MIVRFFCYDPAIKGVRFIVLDTDQPYLDSELREPTEEGFHAVHTRWELDEEGGRVVCTQDTDGRDCDGRHSTHEVEACPLADLAGFQPRAPTTWVGDKAVEGAVEPFQTPIWTRIEGSQRDYAAEAAGY